MNRPQPDGLIVVGPVVVLSGAMLRTALRAVLVAAEARTANGIRNSVDYTQLAQALHHAMSASRQSDVAEPAPLQHYPQQLPTITVKEAAARLDRSPRQTQRLAPRLGGKLIAGRWLLDDQAIPEHLEGKGPE